MYRTEFDSLNQGAAQSHVTVYFEHFSYAEHHTEAERHAMKYVEYVADVLKDESNYIDEGGAGKIYEVSDGSCLKIMKNRHMSKDSHMMNLGLSPVQEFQVLEKLHGLEVSSCRAPVAEMCLESGETAVIVMEKLPAINLQHVLNGTKELPEGFDYGFFFKTLEDYIDAMHKDRGIAHKDLYPRNIMIDEETGGPYVIDFGRAVVLDKLRADVAAKHTEDDWKRYDEIFTEMDKLRANLSPKHEAVIIREEQYTFTGNVQLHYSERVLGEARYLIESHPSQDDMVLRFGKKEDLLITTDVTKVRSAVHLEVHGKVYHLGRRKKDYTIV